MPRFRSKPSEIEAEQFNCGAAHWPAGVERVVDNSANVPSVEYRVKTAGGWAEVFHGDYVVTEPDGRGHYPVRPDIFEKRWELIP